MTTRRHGDTCQSDEAACMSVSKGLSIMDGGDPPIQTRLERRPRLSGPSNFAFRTACVFSGHPESSRTCRNNPSGWLHFGPPPINIPQLVTPNYRRSAKRRHHPTGSVQVPFHLQDNSWTRSSGHNSLAFPLRSRQPSDTYRTVPTEYV